MAAAGSAVGGANQGFQQGIGILQKQAQIELEARRTAVAERPPSRAKTAGEKDASPGFLKLGAEIVSKQVGRVVGVEEMPTTTSELNRLISSATSAAGQTTRKKLGARGLNLRAAELKQSSRALEENLRVAWASLRDRSVRTEMGLRKLDVKIFVTTLETIKVLDKLLSETDTFPGWARVMWSNTFGEPFPEGTITAADAKDRRAKLAELAAKMAATVEKEGIPKAKPGGGQRTQPTEGAQDDGLFDFFDDLPDQ